MASAEESIAFSATLAKGINILEAFHPDRPLLGNAELAELTGFSRPTVARLTRTLEALGYLQYQVNSAKYALGFQVLRFSHPVLANMRFRQIARPLMQDLATSVKGAVSIAVLDGLNLIYVETALSPHHVVEHAPEVGYSRVATNSAMGLALVSMLGPDERAAFEQNLKTYHPDLWPGYSAAITACIKSIDQNGFLVYRGKVIHAAGVPLFRDAHECEGRPVAINCGITSFRLQQGQLEADVGPRLRELAEAIRSLHESKRRPAPKDRLKAETKVFTRRRK